MGRGVITNSHRMLYNLVRFIGEGDVKGRLSVPRTRVGSGGRAEGGPGSAQGAEETDQQGGDVISTQHPL